MKYLLALMVGLFLFPITAEAAHRHHHSHSYSKAYKKKHVSQKRYNVASRKKHYKVASSRGAGARPGRWCGWWMRTQFGGGAEYNLARNWARRGSPSGPRVGAVVVWPHHVGYITGRTASGQWVVKSGNDGGRVRERPRSVAGAIAFRVL